MDIQRLVLVRLTSVRWRRKPGREEGTKWNTNRKASISYLVIQEQQLAATTATMTGRLYDSNGLLEDKDNSTRWINGSQCADWIVVTDADEACVYVTFNRRRGRGVLHITSNSYRTSFPEVTTNLIVQRRTRKQPCFVNTSVQTEYSVISFSSTLLAVLIVLYWCCIITEISSTSKNEGLLSSLQSSLQTEQRHRKRKQLFSDPPTLPNIQRDTQIKILGVTITNHLSVSEHVRDVIGKCGQTMYVLKVLRSHGLNDAALKDIYKAVVLAKLLYASPAWWGCHSYRQTPHWSFRSPWRSFTVIWCRWSYTVHLLNSQMLMKLFSLGSHETNIMSCTVSYLNLTAINIICTLDGITFLYLSKRTIGIL